jgi:hypothetical protein
LIQGKSGDEENNDQFKVTNTENKLGKSPVSHKKHAHNGDNVNQVKGNALPPKPFIRCSIRVGRVGKWEVSDIEREDNLNCKEHVHSNEEAQSFGDDVFLLVFEDFGLRLQSCPSCSKLLPT